MYARDGAEEGMSSYAPQLGFAVAPIVGAAVTQALPGILKKPSERYAGGPLMGTVQAYMNDLAAGNTSRLREMWSLAQRDGEQGWGAVWREEVRPRATGYAVAIRQAGALLDPQWPAGTTAAPSAVTVAANQPILRSGVEPRPLPPVIEAIVRAATPVLMQTPTGQEVVRTAVEEQAAQTYTSAAKFLLPVAIGGIALMMLAKRK
jgi:hypothetical protein